MLRIYGTSIKRAQRQYALAPEGMQLYGIENIKNIFGYLLLDSKINIQ